MVDNQFGGRQRIDFVGRATEFDDGVAHGGKIDDGGYACEVLQDYAARRERDFGAWSCLRIPVGQRENIVASHVATILMPQQVFEQDFQREGQLSCVPFSYGIEAEYFKAVVTNSKRRARAEAVLHRVFSGIVWVSRDQQGHRAGAL